MAMTFDAHVLNGDALAARFPIARIPGELIVMREALVDGEVGGTTDSLFFAQRAGHHQVSMEAYHKHVVSEWEKLDALRAKAAIYLWFGYDLFCQVNLWFLLNRLSGAPHSLYIVYPSHLPADRVWEDFGSATHDDLVFCHQEAVRLEPDGLSLGVQLWRAFQQDDRDALTALSLTPTHYFPFLREVCLAHAERAPNASGEERPERTTRKIISEGATTFEEAFLEFSRREGVYGFGDTQFRKVYEKAVMRPT